MLLQIIGKKEGSETMERKIVMQSKVIVHDEPLKSGNKKPLSKIS